LGRKIVTSSLPSWTDKRKYLLPLSNFWEYPVSGKYILHLKNGREEKKLPIFIK
jgi:hypothetical protein